MGGWGTAVLVGLRSLVVVVAMAVVALGAWSLHTIRDADSRGQTVVDTSTFDDDMKGKWQAFLDEVTESQIRVWIAIGAGSFAFITALFIFLSQKVDRFKTSPYIAIPLEFLSMLSMAATFALSLTFTLKVGPLCQGLDSTSSSDLAKFNMLCPLSTGDTAAGGAGFTILVITSIASLITACRRARDERICSFEPTASGLGMGHEYAAVVPPIQRGTIPTIYDPRKPIPGTPSRPPREDEIGLADSGAGMSRRDSGLSDTTIGEIEKDFISGPLSLEKPEIVKQLARPARPWSEVPKLREG